MNTTCFESVSSKTLKKKKGGQREERRTWQHENVGALGAHFILSGFLDLRSCSSMISGHFVLNELPPVDP